MPRFISSTVAFARRHPRGVAAAQIVAVAVFVGAALWAISGELDAASDRLAEANVLEFFLGCAAIAAYYLLFVVGWMIILAAWGVRIGYGAALQAEMVSMLAKYVPGGIWTPAARVVAARRAGVTNTGLVTASILVEAALSAIAGVLVFVVSLTWVGDVNAHVPALIAFAALLVAALHPRIFEPAASWVTTKLGGTRIRPLPWPRIALLLAYYSFTWVVGGVGLFLLVRSVGGDPGLAAIPFLGGVGAVGAIVAVLSVFAPSGLGPREASMYALLLAVTSPAIALGAVALNRLAITIVEVLLLVVGGLLLRRRQQRDKLAVAPDGSA
ncbi:MAG TPA: lysylphosphatidylglycerol synthase domain-containing protein [Gaiellaceae bacterium]